MCNNNIIILRTLCDAYDIYDTYDIYDIYNIYDIYDTIFMIFMIFIIFMTHVTVPMKTIGKVQRVTAPGRFGLPR